MSILTKIYLVLAVPLCGYLAISAGNLAYQAKLARISQERNEQKAKELEEQALWITYKELVAQGLIKPMK